MTKFFSIFLYFHHLWIFVNYSIPDVGVWEDSFVSWLDDFGDVVHLKVDEGVFTVESQVGYTYDPDTKKQWKIESKNGQNLTLKFDWFDIQSSGDPDCKFLLCGCSFDKVKIIVDDDESNEDFWCPSALQSFLVFLFHLSVSFQLSRIEVW